MRRHQDQQDREPQEVRGRGHPDHEVQAEAARLPR